jgi:hypothetical protein
MSYSVFDSNMPVSKEEFVVSILRKPHSSEPEQAFLMVEGINVYGKYIIRRYDFTRDAIDTSKAKIIVKPEVISEVNEAESMVVDNILRGEEVFSISWSITKLQAQDLHNDILKDEQSPPIYREKVDLLIPSPSSSLEGESAFSWARKKLHNLQDERISLKEQYADFVNASASHHLKGTAEGSGNCLVM